MYGNRTHEAAESTASSHHITQRNVVKVGMC